MVTALLICKGIPAVGIACWCLLPQGFEGESKHQPRRSACSAGAHSMAGSVIPLQQGRSAGTHSQGRSVLALIPARHS